MQLSKIKEIENRIIQLQKVKQIDKKTRNRLKVLYETCEEQIFIIDNYEFSNVDGTMDEVIHEVEKYELYFRFWDNLKVHSVSDRSR